MENDRVSASQRKGGNELMIAIVDIAAVKWAVQTCFKRSATALLRLAFRALFVGCVERPRVLPAFAALARVTWKCGGRNEL
jgi:hypothetical protein